MKSNGYVPFDIESYMGVTRITELKRDILDLDKTFNCGQSFRWRRVADRTYFGVIYDIPMLLKEMQFNDGKYGIATTATTEQVRNILIDYLQLNIDYSELLNISNIDNFARKAAEYGKGIRILSQEPWEALVSFIISQRNNIPKITSTIDKLCKALGKEVALTVGDKTYTDYTFPTAEDIVQAGIEGLQGLGLGYRDEYVISAAKKISNGTFKLNELLSENVTGDMAIYELQKLYGVGPKVANCVALFGLRKLDMFPIDVWIQRIIDTYYPNGIDITRYGKFAGLIQQYMFYYIKTK